MQRFSILPSWLPAVATLALSLPAQRAEEADPVERLRAGEAPRALDELRAFEAHLQSVVDRVMPTVVNVGGGSGVIVKDRLVLTAGHVIRQPGQKVAIVLHDGRRIAGETLGVNETTDTGLIRITEEGEYPAAELGRMDALSLGTWCFEVGHPGGRRAAGAPVRLGRVLAGIEEGWLTTDCTMSGGDSGGPLFDLDGNVIGINSRISDNLLENMHVPIRAFHGEWEALLAGEHVRPERGSNRRGGGGLPLDRLGLTLEDGKLAVADVRGESAAALAGFHRGDVIASIGGEPVDDPQGLQRRWFAAMRDARGGPVEVVVQRERWPVTLRLDLRAARPGRGR